MWILAGYTAMAVLVGASVTAIFYKHDSYANHNYPPEFDHWMVGMACGLLWPMTLVGGVLLLGMKLVYRTVTKWLERAES